MTNGDRLQQILNIDNDCVDVWGEDGKMFFSVTQEWWLSESDNKGEKKVGDLTLREIRQMCDKKFDKELIYSCEPCSASEFCPCDYILKAPFLWDSADLEKELPRGDKAE